MLGSTTTDATFADANNNKLCGARASTSKSRAPYSPYSMGYFFWLSTVLRSYSESALRMS